MKAWVGTLTDATSGGLLWTRAFATKALALSWLNVNRPLCKSTTLAVHEIDMDPHAGFQTVNMSQLNADGSRQDAEYLREQNNEEAPDRAEYGSY